MSMIKPSIEELLPKADNKYVLVVMAAKRARHLVANGQSGGEEWVQEKPVSRALREIAEDLISYAPATDDFIPETLEEQVEVLDDFDEVAEEPVQDMEDGSEPNE